MLENEELKDAILLVLANKQDKATSQRLDSRYATDSGTTNIALLLSVARR